MIAAAGPGGVDPSWLVPVGTVLAALLAFGGVVVTAVIRKPPEVSDLLSRMKVLEDRNDKIGADLQVLRSDADGSRQEAFRRFGIMSRAVDALASYVERLRLSWPPGPKPPEMLPSELDALQQARQAQQDPHPD